MGMFVVTQNGKRLPVDDSNIDENEYFRFQNNVALYTDNTILKKCYIMQLQKYDAFANKNKFELEFVKELKYDHYPTENDILYAMSEYGITRYAGVVTVVEGYEVDISDNE